jgi:propionyl-CoA carboxylase beta chain
MPTYRTQGKRSLNFLSADREWSFCTTVTLTDSSEAACIGRVRALLSYLPSNNLDDPPAAPSEDPVDRQEPKLETLVPTDASQPYDMRELVALTVDGGHFLEVQEHYAKNIIVGFAHYGGRSVGVVANQPMHLAGCLDIDASIKAARFVRFCDAFNLPVVTFVDVPGFLPGVGQEHNGIIKHGAKLLYAFCEATVPKVTIITRKAYGGAYDVMSSKHIRGDFNYAYPTAEIAVMGPDGAVNIVYRKELSEAADPDSAKTAYVEKYRDTFANPFKAAELGYIDAIISPCETRLTIVRALEALENKRDTNPAKKHGSIPL